LPADRTDRTLLVALAACCAVPMIGFVVLTSVVGIALGPAAAIALGVVAAVVCIAFMVQHHRGGRDPHEGHDHGH